MKWISEHLETLGAFVATSVFGLLIWIARRGGAEAWHTMQATHDHERRLCSIETHLTKREVLCTDHREELSEIKELIAEGSMKTLIAIGDIGQRVAKLEGINRERHRLHRRGMEDSQE